MGLGFSTRIAQAADSLSGERIRTHTLGLNALRCCPLERWSGAGATIVDVKTLLRHVLHHLLAIHRFCQEVRWVVVGAHLNHSQLALLHFVLYPGVLDLNMPRLPKALAMRCANGRSCVRTHNNYDLFATIRPHGYEPLGLGCSFKHAVELGLAARRRRDLLS